MKDSTTDKIKGEAHEMKGAVKEKAGKLLHNPALEADGHHEKTAGKIQKKVGEIEKVLDK